MKENINVVSVREEPQNLEVIKKYLNKETRPLNFGELHLILLRFKFMLEEEPNRYTIEEFIEQEDFRRKIFLP
jgi:hypothetical protein